jgi:tRNA threonylcarbamoyladenosine biosynthesis protein TsaE
VTVELTSGSPEDTLTIARLLGSALLPGDVVALTGDLGAGKTWFCKGLGEMCGISPDRIVSPSFTIVTEHGGEPALTHVDVYRLGTLREAEEIGLEETLAGGGGGVCVVEWAEKVSEMLPRDSIRVTFTIAGADRRTITVSAPDQPRFADFGSRSQRFQPGG